jgi:hypothetical protein
MRHFASVKALWLAPLLFAPYALADEAADRIAIRRAIATLNEPSPNGALFTASSDATVTISHEPWGEATITFRVESLALP